MNSKLRIGFLIAAVAWVMALPFAVDWQVAFAETTRKENQEATAETGGDDIFPSRITVERDGTIRAWVCLATSGVFSLVIMNKAGTVVLDVVDFDRGGALGADDGRVFDWASRVDRSYNYRTSVSGDVTLSVDQIDGQ